MLPNKTTKINVRKVVLLLNKASFSYKEFQLVYSKNCYLADRNP